MPHEHCEQHDVTLPHRHYCLPFSVNVVRRQWHTFQCVARNCLTACINFHKNNNLSRKDFGKLVFLCSAHCLLALLCAWYKKAHQYLGQHYDSILFHGKVLRRKWLNEAQYRQKEKYRIEM